MGGQISHNEFGAECMTVFAPALQPADGARGCAAAGPARASSRPGPGVGADGVTQAASASELERQPGRPGLRPLGSVRRRRAAADRRRHRPAARAAARKFGAGPRDSGAAVRRQTTWVTSLGKVWARVVQRGMDHDSHGL